MFPSLTVRQVCLGLGGEVRCNEKDMGFCGDSFCSTQHKITICGTSSSAALLSHQVVVCATVSKTVSLFFSEPEDAADTLPETLHLGEVLPSHQHTTSSLCVSQSLLAFLGGSSLLRFGRSSTTRCFSSSFLTSSDTTLLQPER